MASSSPRLILASKSISRRQILESAGVPFKWVDADIDETEIKNLGLASGQSPDEIALKLAHAKAEHVFGHNPEAMVLGCDQILVCQDKIYDKPKDITEARAHLQSFRGRDHTLISTMVLLATEATPWTFTDHATLTIRDISDTYLEKYLQAEGDSILTSVGAYRLEGRGIQLFDDIVGNYFAILGLPLLPLLGELRRRGGLET